MQIINGRVNKFVLNKDDEDSILVLLRCGDGCNPSLHKFSDEEARYRAKYICGVSIPFSEFDIMTEHRFIHGVIDIRQANREIILNRYRLQEGLIG